MLACRDIGVGAAAQAQGIDLARRPRRDHADPAGENDEGDEQRVVDSAGRARVERRCRRRKAQRDDDESQSRGPARPRQQRFDEHRARIHGPPRDRHENGVACERRHDRNDDGREVDRPRGRPRREFADPRRGFRRERLVAVLLHPAVPY